MEKTLAIIKPNAVKAGHTGAIINKIEEAGFQIKQLTMTHLSLERAQKFYGVHVERPFYHSLCNYMASGPVIAMELNKENAVADFRALIGATNPAEAAPGTLRQLFGENIDHNALHGSDSPTNGTQEVDFFFQCCRKETTSCC